jgi:hypothetical protein
MLIGRTSGPLTLRLILQPSIAGILAIRAGWKDARAGRPPYFWTILHSPSDRRELFREGWKDIGKVTVMALVLDGVYQFIEFHWIYVLQALIVAIVLAIIPYLVLRGLTTRLVGRGGATNAGGAPQAPER